jgi:two-component sensor histidine kinase
LRHLFPGSDVSPDEQRIASLLPLMALLVPLGMMVGGGWLMWRAVWADATAELIRTAGATAEYGARALNGYALGASRINERLRGLSDQDITRSEAELHFGLQRFVAEMPQTTLIHVVDRTGHPLLANTVLPVPRETSLADRDYFQAFSQGQASGVFISRQFQSRFDGHLLFSVSRPRTGTGNVLPAGSEFDGVIAVSVDPNVLAQGMRRLPAPTDGVALVRNDGFIISQSSGQPAPLEPIPPESPFHAIVAGTRAERAYRSTRMIDGAAAVFAVAPVEGFAVQATSLRPRAAIVAQWRRSMAGYVIAGVPAMFALLWLSLRVRADQARLRAANAALGRDLQRDADRLDRAARLGLVGTFEFDLQTGVTTRSAEYMALQGLPAQPAVETHADWVQRLHPDDRVRAEADLLEALSDGSGSTEYAQSYRVMYPSGEVRWIAARGEIDRGPDGRALRMRGAHVDVTPLRETQMALAENDARLRLAQEAVGIGTWEWFPPSRTLNWSPKMIELWGFDPAAGQPDLQEAVARIHPQDRGRVRREMALAHRYGRLLSEFRIVHPAAGGAGQTIWVAVRARLLPLEGGPEARLIGVASDISDRKEAEAHARMLAHEVEHRAKNALAVVAALLRVTKADNHEEYVEVLGARVRALAGSMALLGRQNWKGAGIRDLLSHELAPFGGAATGAASPFVLSGPEVMVSAAVAQPLTMAIHEMTTNAAKYGALSVAEGRLEVTWRLEGQTVVMAWRETGGPPVAAPPGRAGFGSQIITHSFMGPLGGGIERQWEPTGLVCDIRFQIEVG